MCGEAVLEGVEEASVVVVAVLEALEEEVLEEAEPEVVGKTLCTQLLVFIGCNTYWHHLFC